MSTAVDPGSQLEAVLLGRYLHTWAQRLKGQHMATGVVSVTSLGTDAKTTLEAQPERHCQLP